MMSPHTRPRRRGAGLLAGAAALTLVLTACSGGTRVGDTSEQTTAPEASGSEAGLGDVEGTIRIAYWGSGPRVELTNGVSDLFIAENPGVTVEPEFADFAAYWERLNVQGASGNLPCVPQLQGRQLETYAGQGMLVDLDPLIESGAINVDDIPQEVIDTGRGADGKLYMIPYGAAYDAVEINATLAEQAGVGLPEEGYNWDDFGEYIREAQEGLPEGIPAANLGGGLPNYFIAWTQSRGETMFEDNQIAFPEESLVEFWTFWEELRNAGATTTAQQRAEEPPQTEQRYVAQGKVMLDSVPGNALTPGQTTLEGLMPGQQLTTVAMPSGEAGSGNVLFTSGFGISANCDNIPTAAAYIDFWANNDEAAALFASNNGGVTNTRHLQQQLDDPELPPLKKHELELYQQVIENEPPAVSYPPGYQANFETGFNRAYETVSLGGTSPEDAAAAFIAEVNAALGAQ
jgi:multiple sugar transport system substrate-binding protein